MITPKQALNDFISSNKVIVDDQFYDFNTEEYDKMLDARPWKKE